MKPSPIATAHKCSVCGLDWKKHPANSGKRGPTLEDCVTLLKAEVARLRRPLTTEVTGNVYPTTKAKWEVKATGA